MRATQTRLARGLAARMARAWTAAAAVKTASNTPPATISPWP